MRRLLIVLSILLSLVYCIDTAHAMGPKRYKQGETQNGLASWYGAEQGHQTSSGERFNPRDLTAAHRRLPFNSIVRVTNLSNGLSVDVRINDRGPWGYSSRIVDVSSAAADILQMKKSGLVPVKLEVIRLGSP
jgi:rare lipoprotein A